MGVSTNVPYRDLSPEEKVIVLHGPAEKKHITVQNHTTGQIADLDFTYFSATYTVTNALSHVKDEKGMKRVEKFLKTGVCPDCHGTRLSEAARAPRLRGISLDQACEKTLSGPSTGSKVPAFPAGRMQPMAKSICESL